MSNIKYLYIDDENDSSVESLINGFNDLNQIFVERMQIKKGQEFSDLKNSIIEKIKSKNYQGLLIDLRLDGTGPDRLEYSAISVSSELRSIAARKEIDSFPIVLCSTIEKISETYNADKTSQDLFDYTFKKSSSPNYPKFSKKLLSLAKGYQKLTTNGFRIEDIFNRQDLNRLDSRIFDSIYDRDTVPYDYAHFTINTLFHRTNPLIKDTILAARLGIDIDASSGWEKLKNVFKDSKYSGLFSEGWDRWWADLVESKFKELTGEKLSFLNARNRVELLIANTEIKELIPARPIKHNVSTEYWTICEAYKKPLDPLEGFKIQTTLEVKPWQEPKYLSLDAILEHIGDEKGLKPHHSEHDRINDRKENLE